MTLINVGALAGTLLSPSILEALGGNYPNLFLIGAGLQFCLLFPLSKIRGAGTSAPESIILTGATEAGDAQVWLKAEPQPEQLGVEPIRT